MVDAVVFCLAFGALRRDSYDRGAGYAVALHISYLRGKKTGSSLHLKRVLCVVPVAPRRPWDWRGGGWTHWTLLLHLHITI